MSWDSNLWPGSYAESLTSYSCGVCESMCFHMPCCKCLPSQLQSLPPVTFLFEWHEALNGSCRKRMQVFLARGHGLVARGRHEYGADAVSEMPLDTSASAGIHRSQRQTISTLQTTRMCVALDAGFASSGIDVCSIWSHSGPNLKFVNAS